ncbi:MAG: hypothetical protein ABW321_00365 [Polyangiales bacterium]
MRPTILPLTALVLGCAGIGCTQPPAEAPATDTFRSYDSADGAHLQSTLMQREAASERTLQGVTQLADGSFLAEEARLDAQGQLLHAEVKLGGGCDQLPTRITLDAQAGTVDVSTPQLTTHWRVPNDLPWVWSPLLSTEHGPVATPLALTVALRGAAAPSSPVHAVRVLDLLHYESDTLMSDQLVARDDVSTHVVLGDDVADMEEAGLPTRIHWAALERDLDAQALERSAGWAALRCAVAARTQAL